MKKLFKIKVLHAGEKSHHESIETYLLSENDEAVYKWVDKNKNLESWSEKLEDDADEEYDLPGGGIGNHKQLIIACKGDIGNEYNEWSDLYYGMTIYGWEEIEINGVDLDPMIKLGIIELDPST